MERNKLWRPAIEFNLTEHCNLRCEHCDHASPMMPTSFADFASFSRDIEVLSAVLHAGELKFLGGEPVLHPGLLDFLRQAKVAGIANRLIVVTNGVLLHKAPEELWELIDGLWISIYPGIKLRFEWEWLQSIIDKYQIFVWRKETPDFAERSLISPLGNDSLVQMVYDNCDLAHLFSCNTIHDGRYYLCSPSVWSERRLGMHGISFTNLAEDSVSIHDCGDLWASLSELITKKDPLKACRFCLGSWARRVPNRQLTRKGLEEFASRNPAEVSALMSPEWMVPRSFLG